MKIALLASNGETVALASRLAVLGASPRIASGDSPLPDSDWLLFDESLPISSPKGRSETRRLIGEALSLGRPVFAFLSPNAPVTPKCAVTFTELLSYSSAASATPASATELLGLDAEPDGDPEIVRLFGDDEGLMQLAALARALAEAHDLTFALIFEPDDNRGVLFASGAYDAITAESIESAVAELFRSAGTN